MQSQGLNKIKSNKCPIDRFYGQITKDFADELLFIAHEFFDDPTKVNDLDEQKKFQLAFQTLLSSQSKVIQAHQSKVGKIIAGIAKGLAITLSVLGIPIYAFVTKKNPMRFFTDFRTDREKTFDEVKEKYSKLRMDCHVKVVSSMVPK